MGDANQERLFCWLPSCGFLPRSAEAVQKQFFHHRTLHRILEPSDLADERIELPVVLFFFDHLGGDHPNSCRIIHSKRSFDCLQRHQDPYPLFPIFGPQHWCFRDCDRTCFGRCCDGHTATTMPCVMLLKLLRLESDKKYTSTLSLYLWPSARMTKA